MLIAGKDGQLRVYENGALLPTPAIDLTSVDLRRQRARSARRRGRPAVHVEPLHLPLLHLQEVRRLRARTRPNSPVNRVSRFVLRRDNVIDPLTRDGADRQHAVAERQPQRGRHPVRQGRLPVRRDRGRGMRLRRRQRMRPLQQRRPRPARPDRQGPAHHRAGGGSRRATRTRARAPLGATSPGGTTPGHRCQETFASGPAQPVADRVRSERRRHPLLHERRRAGTWEEIDLGQAGADYGWNVREGHCATDSTTNCGPPPAGMTNPIFDYAAPERLRLDHRRRVRAGRGLAGRLRRRLPVPGPRAAARSSASSTGAAAASRQPTSRRTSAPTAWSTCDSDPTGRRQALYYITWATFPQQVRRIAFTGQANRAPTARASANRQSGNLPLGGELRRHRVRVTRTATRSPTNGTSATDRRTRSAPRRHTPTPPRGLSRRP